MLQDDLSNLCKLETIWKQGFTIVASRIGEWLRTKGVDCSFEMVDVPPGKRINRLNDNFVHLWERLPLYEWNLPKIGELIGFKVGEYIDPQTGEKEDVIAEKCFLPWVINGINLDHDNRIEAYISVRGTMSVEWLEENVKRCLDDEYQWWVGFFHHFRAKLEKELCGQIEPDSNGKLWRVWIGDDMRVRRDGYRESIDLSALNPPIRSIAQSLIDRRGNVVEDIDLQSPDSEMDLEPVTIRSYITRLRKLLEPLDIKIDRVRGCGYRISL